jgi:hypothetical protein
MFAAINFGENIVGIFGRAGVALAKSKNRLKKVRNHRLKS